MKDESRGFVFVQIGMLELCDDEEVNQDSLTIQRAAKSQWHETGFAVVVEVQEYNKAGAVVFIYNFFPIDHHDAGERYHTTYERKWGRLWYRCPEQFSVARIADSVDDLGWGKTLAFDIWARHEVELVTVTLTGEGHPVRRMVEHKI